MQARPKTLIYRNHNSLSFRALCREMGAPDVTLEDDPEPYAEELLPLDFIQSLGLPDHLNH